jgi:hypothetical protein
VENLRGFVLALLYYCKSKEDCDLSIINDRPLKNLLEKISVHSQFKEIFEVEIAEQLICSYLNLVMSQGKISFNNEDADEFLNNLYSQLKQNISEHWIVIPLKGAYLTETIRFKDFIFISGDIEEKTDVLRRLGKTSKSKAIHRVNHTLTCKSRHFFEHPLLAIRVRHQYGYVFNIARRFSFYANCILHAIYWGKVHPNYELPLLHNPYGTDDANHLLIYGKEDWCIKHLPARFNTNCKLNLDFFNEKTYLKLFSDIFNILMHNSLGKVSIKFLHGFKFLKKSIDLESKEDIYQGLSISLLLLTTASESILLKREDAKRDRLSVLYSRLVNLDNLTNIEIANILNKIYGWRSEFVHGGTEIYRDYNDDFSDGLTTNTYVNYKKILSHLLSKTVYFISLVERRSQNPTVLSKDEIWHKYLNNHFDRGQWIIRNNNRP